MPHNDNKKARNSTTHARKKKVWGKSKWMNEQIFVDCLRPIWPGVTFYIAPCNLGNQYIGFDVYALFPCLKILKITDNRAKNTTFRCNSVVFFCQTFVTFSWLCSWKYVPIWKNNMANSKYGSKLQHLRHELLCSHKLYFQKNQTRKTNIKQSWMLWK